MKWTITYYSDNIGTPHTKALENGLLELRIKAKEGIARVFYCAHIGYEIVVLHSFIKKSQKLPKKELKIAMKRLNEVRENAKAFDETA